MNFVKVKKMKRTIFSLLLIAATISFIFASNANNDVKDDIEDRIELGREGGTTRIAPNKMYSVQKSRADEVEPIVEAYKNNNEINIVISNYSGSVSVEIIEGIREVKYSSFEVYNDFASETIKLNGVPAGYYTIRIVLDNDVFTGEFRKGKNGHYK
jgi:Na+-translocating ferredoxin:NAD+ oxidoreductase RnfG subunit